MKGYTTSICSTDYNVDYTVYNYRPSSLSINGVDFMFKLTEMSSNDLFNDQDEMDRLQNLVEIINSLNIKHVRPSKVEVDEQTCCGVEFSAGNGLLYISLDGYGHLIYNIEHKTVTYGNMEVYSCELKKTIEDLLLVSSISDLSQENYPIGSYYMINDICRYLIGCRKFMCEEIKHAIRSKMSKPAHTRR